MTRSSRPGTLLVRAAIAGLGGLAILGACASRPAVPTVAVGCYYFERDAAAERLQLPWGVQLLDEPVTGFPAIEQLPGVRRAVTLVDAARTAAHPFGYWRSAGGDSLEIGYPAGGGLLLELRTQPGRLVGSAVPVGDAMRLPAEGQPRTRDAVSLVHASCPEE